MLKRPDLCELLHVFTSQNSPILTEIKCTHSLRSLGHCGGANKLLGGRGGGEKSKLKPSKTNVNT